MQKRMIKKEDLFLVRLNMDELFLVCGAAELDEMMFKKDGRKEWYEVARSVQRKIGDSIGRRLWPATAYAEVPIHG